MNRAFISLYVIIVLSIILLGVVLNTFWDVINPAYDIDPAISDLIRVVEMLVKQNPHQDQAQLLSAISQQTHFDFYLTGLNDFSENSALEKIKSGLLITAANEDHHVFYQRILETDWVLVVSDKAADKNNSLLYLAFILAFYAAIAVTIFLWVWPLSRDLTRLEQSTKNIGREGVGPTITVSSRSVLFHFSSALNKMTQRINELIRSQKEMTYAVSHELRTPLARMKFALAITQEKALPAPLQKQLSNIHQDVVDMESLINSLLMYAGFEQQTQRLSQREGHITDLISTMLSRLSVHKQSSIDVSIMDQSNGEKFVCEWSLMQTALQNVLENAFDFAKERMLITLTITAQEHIISIEDDGPGIPPSERTRVFESFVRLYNDERSRAGFGLGLAIVKRILSWHKGDAVCEQSSMGGALVRLSWPRAVETGETKKIVS